MLAFPKDKQTGSSRIGCCQLPSLPFVGGRTRTVLLMAIFRGQSFNLCFFHCSTSSPFDNGTRGHVLGPSLQHVCSIDSLYSFSDDLKWEDEALASFPTVSDSQWQCSQSILQKQSQCVFIAVIHMLYSLMHSLGGSHSCLHASFSVTRLPCCLAALLL